jgi:hypothetical protein
MEQIFTEESLDTIHLFADELLYHQKYVPCLDSMYNALDNNKHVNQFMHSGLPPFYIAAEPSSELCDSLSLIQILKDTVGKDVKIGGNVKYCIFELRPKLSVLRIIDKCSLLLFEKKKKGRKGRKI